MDYSYYYEAARHALDAHAAVVTRREHGVAQVAAVRAQARRARRAPVPWLAACASRSSSTSSRPSKRASASASTSRARPHHAHRPLAPVQGLRADAHTVEELPPVDFDARPGQEVHRLGRLRRPAARLRQPRQLHGLRHATRSASSSSASSTTSSSPPTRSCARASSGTSRTDSSLAFDRRLASGDRGRQRMQNKSLAVT